MVHDVDVHVAVAGVAEYHDRQGHFGRQRLHRGHQVGDARDRHHHVLVDLARGDGAQRRRQRAPCRPQPVAGGTVGGHVQVQQAIAAGGIGQCLQGQRQGFRVAVGLHQQHRTGLGDLAAVAPEQGQRSRVHEFEHGRHLRLAHQSRHRRRRGDRVAVKRTQGRLRGRSRQQAQGGFHDQRQGAFAADQQVGEVVAGGVLGPGPAAADDLAAAGHRHHAEHVVAAGAVLDRARATGIAGQVAADGAAFVAGRIRRPEQAVRLQRLLQVAVAHARFDHHAAVAGADLHDPVHVRERNHHPAGEGHRRTGGSGAGATGDHRHPVLAAGAHDRGHLVAVARQCHRVGQGGHVRIILAVGAAQRLAGEPAIGAEQGGQFNVQRGGQCVRHRSIVCRSWRAWPIPPAALPVGRRVPRPGACACPQAGRYTSSRRKASFIQLSCGAAGSPLASTTSKRHGRRARRGRGPR